MFKGPLPGFGLYKNGVPSVDASRTLSPANGFLVAW